MRQMAQMNGDPMAIVVEAENTTDTQQPDQLPLEEQVEKKTLTTQALVALDNQLREAMHTRWITVEIDTEIEKEREREKDAGKRKDKNIEYCLK